MGGGRLPEARMSLSRCTGLLSLVLLTHLRPLEHWLAWNRPQLRPDGCQRTRRARLSGDEGQRRGKTSRWKRRATISGFQGLGGRPEHGDEPSVALVEGFSRCLAEGVEERRRRTRELRRTVLGILGEDRLDAGHGLSGLAPPQSRFLFDRLHQSCNARLIDIRR